LLVVAERLKRQQAATQLTQVTAWDALVIGLFQAFALLPGVSRSGSTITGGLMRGLDRRTAARFSFLMSVPVMLGAGVIGLKDLLETPNFQQYTGAIAVGFVVSAVVGWLTIHWLLGFFTATLTLRLRGLLRRGCIARARASSLAGTKQCHTTRRC
jgi:undecaprenyl-diphosphatase